MGPDSRHRPQGTYLTLHYAIHHLRKAGGSKIVCSSVNGNRTFGTAAVSAYITSKSGQVAFMTMAALEPARYNIRVNAVCPGAIRTDIQQRTQVRQTERVEIKVKLPEGNPGIGHGQGTPEMIATVGDPQRASGVLERH